MDEKPHLRLAPEPAPEPELPENVRLLPSSGNPSADIQRQLNEIIGYLSPKPEPESESEPEVVLTKAELARYWAELRARESARESAREPAQLEMAAGLEEIPQGLRSRTDSR